MRLERECRFLLPKAMEAVPFVFDAIRELYGGERTRDIVEAVRIAELANARVVAIDAQIVGKRDLVQPFTVCSGR